MGLSLFTDAVKSPLSALGGRLHPWPTGSSYRPLAGGYHHAAVSWTCAPCSIPSYPLDSAVCSGVFQVTFGDEKFHRQGADRESSNTITSPHGKPWPVV